MAIFPISCVYNVNIKLLLFHKGVREMDMCEPVNGVSKQSERSPAEYEWCGQMNVASDRMTRTGKTHLSVTKNATYVIARLCPPA